MTPTQIPNDCPHCGNDLTAEGGIIDWDYLPVTYGGRVVDGDYENDGNGFDWNDQDGGMSEIRCASCWTIVRAATDVRIPRKVLNDLHLIVGVVIQKRNEEREGEASTEDLLDALAGLDEAREVLSKHLTRTR